MKKEQSNQENEDQEISLNWSSEPSKPKSEKIKQEDEEPEIEDIVEETFSPQPTQISTTLEQEQIQDQPIQNLETDLQNASGQNLEQEQTITYDSNAGAYDSEPALMGSPSLKQSPQGIQQSTKFESPSAWRQAKIQNSAWEQSKINETTHINPTDIKKYNPFSEDFAKRRRK